MLPTSRLSFRDAYCSAPPLESSFRPPCLSRETEAVRPRVPLRPVKREIRESEASSAEFFCDDADEAEVKEETVVKIEADPRQICARLAAVSIEPPAPSASSSSEDIAGPSGTAYRNPPPHPVEPVRPRGPAPRSRPTQRVQEQAAGPAHPRDLRATRAGRSRQGQGRDGAAQEVGPGAPTPIPLGLPPVPK